MSKILTEVGDEELRCNFWKLTKEEKSLLDIVFGKFLE